MKHFMKELKYFRKELKEFLNSRQESSLANIFFLKFRKYSSGQKYCTKDQIFENHDFFDDFLRDIDSDLFL